MKEVEDEPIPVPWEIDFRYETGPLVCAGVIANPDQANTIVACHGWLDNANSFVRIANELPEYRFVALDFPGHGQSAHRPPGDFYHFIDYAHALVSALDALDLEKVTLMGHSMGAAICMAVAGAFPGRVERLILIDGMAPLASTPERAPLHLKSGIKDRINKRNREHRPYDTLEEMQARMQEANPMLTDQACELLLERGAVFHGSHWTFAHDLRLRHASLMRFSEEANRAFMRQVTADTLLIRAEHGGLQDDEAVAERIALFDSITDAPLPGDHHLHLNSPGPVAERIREFLGLDN